MTDDEDFARIVVPSSAYPYLQMQRGAISDLRGDASTWLTQYVNTILGEFRCIEPYLPATCDAVLDVGSGLGGIDILLQRHYGDSCHVTLLDGADDAPMVQSHAKTFNHMGVARNFLAANGVVNVHCVDANAGVLRAPSFFDLVVSFKSWCFHVEPRRYIDFVRTNSIPGGQTKVIVDMRRRDKEQARFYDWHAQMSAAFRHVALIYQGPKVETHLWETP